MAIELSAANDDLNSLWQHANGLAADGDLAEAIAVYQQIAMAQPQLVQVWINLGSVLSRTGQSAEAVRCLQEAVQLDPFDAAARLSLGDALQAAGRANDAVMQYREATRIDAERQPAWERLGAALLRQGQVAEAERCLLQAHALDPTEAECNFHLGNFYGEREDHDRAVSYLQAAYEAPPDPAVANNLGQTLYHLARYEEALPILEACVRAKPDYALAWNTYGGALNACGRHDEAGQAFARAVEAAPEFLAARQNLARTRAGQKDLAGARQIYEELIGLAPDDASIRIDYARVLLSFGLSEDAAQVLQTALERDPRSVGGWLTLAGIREQQSRWREQLDAAMRTLELDMEVAAGHILAATALLRLGQDELAEERLRAATQLAGDNPDLLDATAGVYETMKLGNAAIALFRRSLALRPDGAIAQARLFDLTMSVCDWSQYDALSQQRMAQLQADVEDPQRPLSLDVFNLQALPISYELTARAARKAARQIAVAARNGGDTAPFVHTRPARDRIRLGYALAYTWVHSLPLVLQELVARHDRDRFELFGYSIRPCNCGEFSRRYRASFDHFRDVPEAAPHSAAQAIHRDEIDLLIDTTGLTSINCMSISSFRPAPVQLHAFGYSITTGADYIDYLISDRTYIPPEAEALGPEKLLYLPHSFMPSWRPPMADDRPSRADCGLPDDAVVFCNFNHPCKFEPSIFDSWMRILAQVPDSVMWFAGWFHDTAAHLRAEAERRGIAGSRLLFAEIATPDTHVARLQLADVALDNRYHGGGVTTVDALWAGVPVLTVLGDTPAARLGATLVQAAGMPELQLPDLAAYEARAVELARDPATLAQLKQKLIGQRDSCPLFDPDGYARHMDAGLAAAWQNHCDGQPPRRIDVADDGQIRFG